tara:strand:+ start:686 stop:883 length:198 start_codon:yes stop_codon:yes gene_type:complete
MISKLIPDRLRSRKLWISVVTSCLVVMVVAVFDISEEQANTIVTGVVSTTAAYLIGQGVADHGKG